MPITPKQFVENWSQSTLREQQGAQSHFNELCELVGHKTPTQADPEGKFFTFEEQVTKATGGKGRADVWKQGHFAWEYKGKHKDLDAAYAQLSAYRGDLGNPPLLVVCDFLEYRIYPQWPNTSGQPFKFTNQDLLDREAQNYIRWLLESPEKFLELRQTELQKREQLTRSLAEKFAHLADLMREHKNEEGQPTWQSMQIARFLTKLVFCLFAEDVDLMPRPFYQPVFRYLTVRAIEGLPEGFVDTLQLLFKAMDGRASFMIEPTPYFNGGLFADSVPGAGDGLEALDLTLIPNGINILGEVSEADWRKVDPSIFGTLFEGALDPQKRTQLGAHFTSESDIRLIVEPVLMLPLYREWDAIRDQAEPLMQAYLKKETPRSEQEARTKLIQLHDQMMNRLEKTRVLDPACGSGNFLYVSLRLMKDLEGKVRKFFEPLALPFRDVVTPRQLYGIEKDEFAAKLAHVVAWIGYLQWRYEDEGILHFKIPRRTEHPRQLPHPIIQDKNSPDEPDRIICADSIMRYDAEGKPYEPEWPEVDVIVGNPPFLGDKKMRSELGNQYVDMLRHLFEDRMLGGVDLVGYWYEKARAHIADGKAKRAGLLATQSIRTGSNRRVLDRIKETGNIFMAWSDRPWVLEGAAVRISLIGFDNGSEKEYLLDGAPVTHINSDLQNTIDATKAKVLTQNKGMAFQGPVKVGAFDISDDVAQAMLKAVNTSGKSNTDVVRPWMNGEDIVSRGRNYWIIDFGLRSEKEATEYEAPFKYVEDHIKPERLKNRDKQRSTNWWRLGRSGEDYKQAAIGLNRQIFTPRVAKHRIFIWAEANVLPDSRVFAICREDDYFFGVLCSKIHELWSIRMASWHGDGGEGGRPTYVASTCFETFPFPWPPGKEDTSSAAYQAISAAAKRLHEERDEWLNPPELMGENAGFGAADLLKKRTLTNLYNALDEYRKRGIGEKSGPRKAPTAADTFAPRLHELHTALDRAVCDAYGWPHEVLGDEEDMLRHLLALNLERAGSAAVGSKPTAT